MGHACVPPCVGQGFVSSSMMIAWCYPFCLIKVPKIAARSKFVASSVADRGRQCVQDSTKYFQLSTGDFADLSVDRGKKGDFGGSYRTFGGKSDFFFIFFEKWRNWCEGCKKVMKSRV